ncbi:MAG: hypothetical protein CL799_05305 [Chromatiales bacterium]|nr:hypothetical protein [Chromatiales bacterium]MDP7092805.1 hypothetical protein [Gammaproteobacteria bacterium]
MARNLVQFIVKTITYMRAGGKNQAMRHCGIETTVLFIFPSNAVSGAFHHHGIFNTGLHIASFA